MAAFVRTKRVTDPLGEEAKARLVGFDQRQLSYASSGSEHSGTDSDSPCLSELVHAFLEYQLDQSENESTLSEFDSERVDSGSDCTELARDMITRLRSNFSSSVDPYRKVLQDHVSKAGETFSFLRSNKSLLRRNVMAFLRDLGHNAAICKTKWDSSGGTTSGNYEFIDVVQSNLSSSNSPSRYFVDLDFANQFAIARPTRQYSELLSSLPAVFVGKGEDIKHIVRGMCEASKRSLKSNELSVPPWRKNRYMQNKWFAPYRRTTNLFPDKPIPSSGLTPSVTGTKCRLIGFDDVVSEIKSGVFVRTR